MDKLMKIKRSKFMDICKKHIEKGIEQGKQQAMKEFEKKVERIKESIKEGVNRNKVLPLDWCFDRIDKIMLKGTGVGENEK